MKVLHLIDSLIAGGKERRLIEFLKCARTMADMQSRLAVLSDTVQYTYIDHLGIPVDYLPRSRRRDFSIFSKLIHLCRVHRPDIIHSWESMCSVYAAPVARLLGIKLINAMITDATEQTFGGRKWLRSRLTFPFSDLILANSYAGLTAYKAPPHKSVCIHNGFDFERIRRMSPPEVIRRRHAITAPKVVGMVGAMSARKDYDSFIQAARDIATRRTDVAFVAVGGGPMLEHYRGMAASGTGGDRIYFVGRQSDVESYIDLFDIGLLLTRIGIHGEGISNAIMEYMALGKPVIATSGGGTAEIVVDDRTGFLIPENEPRLLHKRMMELLDDPSRAAAMGRAGKRRIQRAFSLEKMTEKIVSCYRSCLDGNSTAGRPAHLFGED